MLRGRPASTASHPEIIDITVERPGVVRVVVHNPGEVDLGAFAISVSNDEANTDRFDATSIRTLRPGQRSIADISVAGLLPPADGGLTGTAHLLTVTARGENGGIHYDARRRIIVHVDGDGNAERVR